MYLDADWRGILKPNSDRTLKVAPGTANWDSEGGWTCRRAARRGHWYKPDHRASLLPPASLIVIYLHHTGLHHTGALAIIGTWQPGAKQVRLDLFDKVSRFPQR